MNITPEMKDKVLYYLRDHCPLEQYVMSKTKDVSDDTGIGYDQLRPILFQFERLGFISEIGVGHSHVNFVLHAELHDYAHKGGFCVEEIVLNANIQKLGYEIDKLEKDLGPEYRESINTMTSILSVIIAGLSLSQNK